MWASQNDEKVLCRKAPVSRSQYINDIFSCENVICPNGNGIDCYRTLETVYLGRRAIVEKSRINSAYSGLPVINGQDAFVIDSRISYENSKADFNYWRNKIQESRKCL